jgi:UDP-N-acetylmuramyl pentapeptide phosphotransferase/UDP-N-acetylglucosamine-1-phosphate transferase
MIEQPAAPHWLLAAAALVALPLSGALIVLLRPVLRRFAMARPNARSSHREPTPQGGGMAVVTAAFAVAWLAAAVAPGLARTHGGELLALSAAAALLALVGAIDDLRPLPASLRLAAQCAAVAGLIALTDPNWRLVPQLPWWIERAGLLVGGVWFVNLVNFMDGIDLMTAAEVVPIIGTVVALGFLGAIGVLPALVAAALAGAMLAFVPFNRPVARLFLGDVGSLPIGLMLGWLLLQLAIAGHAAAALILPLYYLADATITLGRRIGRGERVWEAHRTHFYQRATDRGFAVSEIIARVFLVNLVLAALAVATVLVDRTPISLAALAAAFAITAWLLRTLAGGRQPAAGAPPPDA